MLSKLPDCPLGLKCVFPHHGTVTRFWPPLQGAVSGSVQATDRLMKELRDIYRSQSFKGGESASEGLEREFCTEDMMMARGPTRLGTPKLPDGSGQNGASLSPWLRWLPVRQA